MPKQSKELRRERVGKVAVIEEEHRQTRSKRFKTECRRAVVPKAMQRREHQSWEEAEAFASRLNLAITRGSVTDFAGEDLELQKISQRFKTEKVLQEVLSEEDRELLGLKGEKPSLEDIYRYGIDTIKLFNKLRKQSKLANRKPLRMMLNEFYWHQKKLIQEQNAKKLNVYIDQIVKIKISRHGGRGRRELEESAKREWKYMMSNLKDWIGECSSAGKENFLKEKVVKGIDKGVNRAGDRKGKEWSPRTKNKNANKAKEFGTWMVSQGNWPKNYFDSLPKDYAVQHHGKAATLKAEEVERIFRVLMRDQNREMIPYFTFLFFTGCRPSELAGVKAERRFSWSQMEKWENDSAVTKGKLCYIPKFNSKGIRMSKSGEDRYGDLTQNGVKWIEWWSLGQLPNKGKMFYSRKMFDRILKEAKVKWIKDYARHTFTSMAHNNTKFKLNNPDYWLDKCGHKRDAYNRHYKAPKTPKEVARYFSITPTKLKDKI